MHVGFYTAGDHEIGMGHLYRCAALAGALAARDPSARISFELVNRPGIGGWQGLRPDWSARTWPEEELPGGPWDILIVDRLSVERTRLEVLKARTGRLVSLDDTGEGHFSADFAFNGLYRCRAPRPEGSLTRSFHGLEYLVLDPALTRAARDRGGPVEQVLLSQGGADTHGKIPELLERLGPWLGRRKGLTLSVLIGPAFRHETQLTTALEALPRPVTVHRGVRDLPGLLARIDLAISAAGVMACELACAGVPSVLVSAEPKEVETALELAGRGCATWLGDWQESHLGGLCGKLDALCEDAAGRLAMSRQGRAAVDGKGAVRILDIVLGGKNP